MGNDDCQNRRHRDLTVGSVSDRALTLANEVAAAVHAKYPGRLVGMYAYSEHSPPPGQYPPGASAISSNVKPKTFV